MSLCLKSISQCKPVLVETQQRAMSLSPLRLWISSLSFQGEKDVSPKASCGKAIGWVEGMVTLLPRTCLSSPSQVHQGPSSMSSRCVILSKYYRNFLCFLYCILLCRWHAPKALESFSTIFSNPSSTQPLWTNPLSKQKGSEKQNE